MGVIFFAFFFYVKMETLCEFSSGFCLFCCRRVALFAGGDVLALLLFSTIGRYSHGRSVFDFETLHTADPFIAGMFCFHDCEIYVLSCCRVALIL